MQTIPQQWGEMFFDRLKSVPLQKKIQYTTAKTKQSKKDITKGDLRDNPEIGIPMITKIKEI